ncbi:DUF5333 domain-containing protein [Nereida sp. MMG025]|uniref:DUF5333 domain-containing protein n=1 Tax=Nereida sp. MMG025 TaxID=2909981 RepID=UPI001F3143C5|nr:DUF5333 domain-containing protein [Nereida sp. MMG025]MCF6445302.1 DUF5333 domain-containing protein [Nereida sp. MMG025]
MSRTAAILLALSLSTTGAFAKSPLSQVDYINDRLFAAAVGDVIRKECGSISARWGRVLSEYNKIKGHAEALGYTDAEIDAYTKSDTEKAKLKSRRDAYLRQAGATRGNEASYCKVGRDEIAKGSLIGSLLKGG